MTSFLYEALNWRPRTPFYYGWLILSMGFLATFAATGISQAVFGAIQVFITEDTGWKKSTISLAVTGGTWAAGLLSPFIGRLADRYGPRWLMPVGIIIVAISLFSLAGVQAIWQFFAAYIVGRAVSQPVMIGVVPRTTAVIFFRRRRNIALSLVSIFRPVGSAINIQIISLIAIHYGWRTAYRYFGILSLIIVGPMVLVMRRQPEDIGLLPDGAKKDEGPVAMPGDLDRGRGRDLEFSWTLREAVSSRAFWLIALTAAFGTLASGAVSFSLVPYLAEDVALSKSTAAGVLSLATFLAIGNLGWGYLAEFITPRRCLVAALLVSGAMVLYLTTVNSLAMALGFALLFGIFSGPEDPLQSMMLAQYFGRNSYGAILGVVAPFQTVMLGFGPALGALYREEFGSYTGLYVGLAICYFIAGIFIFMAKPPALPARASAEEAAQAR